MSSHKPVPWHQGRRGRPHLTAARTARKQCRDFSGRVKFNAGSSAGRWVQPRLQAMACSAPVAVKVVSREREGRMNKSRVTQRSRRTPPSCQDCIAGIATIVGRHIAECDSGGNMGCNRNRKSLVLWLWVSRAWSCVPSKMLDTCAPPGRHCWYQTKQIRESESPLLGASSERDMPELTCVCVCRLVTQLRRQTAQMAAGPQRQSALWRMQRMYPAC